MPLLAFTRGKDWIFILKKETSESRCCARTVQRHLFPLLKPNQWLALARAREEDLSLTRVPTHPDGCGSRVYSYFTHGETET